MPPPAKLRFASLALAVGVATVVLAPAAARAQPGGWMGTRALGMGGALRSAATGDAGPTINPSGMSLIRAYTAEGGYQLNTGGNPDTAHRAHASIVDSTSATSLGGALAYTFLSSDVRSGRTESGHQGSASLSLPFGELIAVGATLKYLRITAENAPVAPVTTKTEEITAGFTFDAGATIRPARILSVGLVGYNLVDSKTALAPRAFGWGTSLAVIDALLVTFDGVIDFSTRRLTTGKDDDVLSLMGGVEYVTPVNVAVRAGGGLNGVRQSGYVSVGASTVSEVGALDLGFAQDLTGDTKQTIFAVSARLFVPTQ